MCIACGELVCAVGGGGKKLGGGRRFIRETDVCSSTPCSWELGYRFRLISSPSISSVVVMILEFA